MSHPLKGQNNNRRPFSCAYLSHIIISGPISACRRISRPHPGNQVIFATKTPREEWVIPGVNKAIFTPDGETSQDGYPLVRNIEDSIRHGMGMLNLCAGLKKAGLHTGRHSRPFRLGTDHVPARHISRHPFVGYFEWYYNATSPETTFDKRKRSSPELAQLRLRNSAIMHDLSSCRVGITPTLWQRSQFPIEYQPKIIQAHDGHQYQLFRTGCRWPDSAGKLDLPDTDLTGAKELITYCSRGLEPYRGFPQFYESLPEILEERPDCHVLIVGEDRVCYSARLPEGESYKKQMMEKVKVDEKRVHFTGPLPYGIYKQVLQASSAHVYLTWPFVLSWSFLEAMSCGCLVIGSNTDPVREVLRHRENGLLTDFHSHKKIAKTVILRSSDRKASQPAQERPSNDSRPILPFKMPARSSQSAGPDGQGWSGPFSTTSTR